MKYVKKFTLILMSLLLILFTPKGAWADGHDRNVFDDLRQNTEQGEASYVDQTQEEPITNPAGMTQQEDISFVTTFIKMVLALVLIIGLIYFLIRVLSRSRAIGLSGPFRLIGGVHLAPNKSIQMVEIGNDLYIVGVGEDVNLLGRIDKPEERDQILESVEGRSTFQASEWKRFKAFINRLAPKHEEVGGSFQSLLSEKLNNYKTRNKAEDTWTVLQEEDREGKPL